MEDAQAFVDDLAWRLRSRVQISADGLRAYVEAIQTTFGETEVDFAQVIKSYEAEPIGPGRYSPPAVSSVEKKPIFGQPLVEYVTTSHAERINLSVRMTSRRYTRLTNAFSKKVEQHYNATALTLAAYNFVRQHKTIRCSPAMAAGIAKTLWSVEDLVEAALDGVRP
jgi:hypothetical protein